MNRCCYLRIERGSAEGWHQVHAEASGLEGARSAAVRDGSVRQDFSEVRGRRAAVLGPDRMVPLRRLGACHAADERRQVLESSDRISEVSDGGLSTAATGAVRSRAPRESGYAKRSKAPRSLFSRILYSAHNHADICLSNCESDMQMTIRSDQIHS